MQHSASRRQFLTASIAAVGTGAFAVPALAQDLKPLPLDNPTAVALAYTQKTEGLSHASFKAGSSCANCNFFTAQTGACQLFPGFTVPPTGWCSAWAAKPAA